MDSGWKESIWNMQTWLDVLALGLVLKCRKFSSHASTFHPSDSLEIIINKTWTRNEVKYFLIDPVTSAHFFSLLCLLLHRIKQDFTQMNMWILSTREQIYTFLLNKYIFTLKQASCWVFFFIFIRITWQLMTRNEFSECKRSRRNIQISFNNKNVLVGSCSSADHFKYTRYVRYILFCPW